MANYRAGVIGVGLRKLPDGKVRQGIAYQHGPAYEKLANTTLVALCDLSTEALEAYAARFAPTAGLFTDYRAMLAEAELDVLSICAWPALHGEMVIAAAEAGVKAIHCEKPMAPTWGEAKRMAAVCAERGVQLTFDHQRRFNGPFRKAKELLAAGEIGQLLRIEGQCPNLMDWGTHWFDMFFFYNDDQPAEWVLGQIDKRTDKEVFHLAMDDQGISWFGFANGVQATLYTGQYADQRGAQNRLIGSAGVIEVGAADGVNVRLMNATSQGWKVIEAPDGLHGGSGFEGALADVVACLESGREPELAARKTLQSTEVIFATYESSRRRGRVDLPLTQEDSALLTMLEEGWIGPDRAGA